MKRIIIAILLALFYFTGCEKSQIVDAEIPYEEYIVVQAELKGESVFKGVSFTRTLPPGVQYNIQDAALKDVVAYIKIDSVQVIPLHHVIEGVYQPLYELEITSGRTYELFAERGDTRIYSRTTIPYEPSVRNAVYNYVSNTFNVYVYHVPKEVYGALWVIGNYQDASLNYPDLSAPDAVGDSVTISTIELPEKYRSSAYNFSRYIKVYSYDTPFYKFYKSIKNNESVNNVFLQGSGTISWNVTGNKVIGLFIGVAEGELIYVN